MYFKFELDFVCFQFLFDIEIQRVEFCLPLLEDTEISYKASIVSGFLYLNKSVTQLFNTTLNLTEIDSKNAVVFAPFYYYYYYFHDLARGLSFEQLTA